MEITKMIRPIMEPYTITSPEGRRKMGWHGGIDYVSRSGNKSILSVADGVVVAVFDKEYNHKLRFLKRRNWGGRWVCVLCNIHGVERMIYYMHIDVIFVKVGDELQKGVFIGKYGKTGYSTGDHLHYEIRTNKNKKIKFLTTNETIKGLNA